MTESMTEGNSLKLILKFALPLLMGNLLQQTYNIVDAAIVGRYLGTDALAGVGASSSVQFLVLGFCIGICLGFAIPVAQRFGADDQRSMREFIFQGAVLAAVIAAICTIACAILCPYILNLLSTPENIYDNAYAYLFVIFLGIPFNILYNYQASILRAVGNSRTPFFFLAFSTVLNIALDLLCIIVFQWGCRGAAIATITAQAISGILCFFYIIRKYTVLKPHKEDKHMDQHKIGALLAMGLPMGLQFSITAIGSMVMQSANNSLGSVYVSGFTAGSRIKQFAMCPFDAIATAVSTFCGQNLGAGKYDRIKQGIRQGTAVGIAYGVFIGLVLIFFGRTLSLIFISSTEATVLDASAKYLRCMGYFFWALGILNVFRMSTQGLGYSGRAVYGGVMEMIARITVSTLLVPHYGYTAICFADQSAWIAACIYIVPTCLNCLKKVRKKIVV
jgi:putative MATE family efflux protein